MTSNINESFLQYLALEFVRVTEKAALAAAAWVGKGDGKAADKAAVDAMRTTFNQIDFRGEIVIGEGAKDESFELYIGELVGKGNGSLLDIAVDPLECTENVAHGFPNAITVIAVAPQGCLYKAADSYMQKIAVGPEAKGIIDLDAPIAEIVNKVARALGKEVGETTVAILDRPRHKQMIQEIRQVGARVVLFNSGDVAMAIAPSLRESPIDMLLGIGGSTEAVLAAAALKCLGGEMLCRWKPKDEKHIARLHGAGVMDFKSVFSRDDLAKGDDVAFIATGVLGGPLLDGVVFSKDHITTHSVIMSSRPRIVRFLKTHHAV